MLIPRATIQEIKDRLDIVSIVGEYVHSLKKSGKNWTGLCPFHNDHNPSFNVAPDLGIYKCFSCGESGDVVGFIQKIENISFTEAVKILAKKAGIEIKQYDDDNSSISYKKDELLQFNNRLIKLFQHFLLNHQEGKAALEYLIKRGITKDLIVTFKLGYAPKGYNRLLNFFLQKGFKTEFLIQTGLFTNSARGINAIFFDRVIFPIINYKDECIGFGGRALSNDIKPKYINSPETLLYKKSYNLYGLDVAKNCIREEKKVYLVEGYMDVISSYKNGLKNSVAPCGTAVTKEQIILLNRYADELVLFLDGDEAGKKGVEKALKESVNLLIKKTVVELPDNLDPDEYFLKYSLMDFREFEKKRIDGFDFLVRYKTANLDLKDYKKLMDALNSVFNYINLWESEVVRNSLILRLSELLNLDKGIIGREFLTFRNKKVYSSNYSGTQVEKSDTAVTFQKLILSKDLKEELDLLIFMIHFQDSATIVRHSGLREEHFQYPETRNLFKLMINENFSLNKKNFIDYFDDNNIKNFVQQRLFDNEFSQPSDILKNNIIDRIINIIKKYYLLLKSEINQKIMLGNLYQDNELVKELLEEKTIITNEIMKVSKLRELKI